MFALIPEGLTADKLRDSSRPELRLPPNAWQDERVFLNRCQFFAKTLYYEGDLTYFESVNKETIKNAIIRLADMGIVLLSKGHSPPTAPVSNKPGKNLITWISVHPDFVPVDPMPLLEPTSVKQEFIYDPTPRAPGQENELDDTISAWYFHRPTGRLWDFCEKIGKFRREGKNRRETAMVSIRVLRLARMSSLWTFDVSGTRKPIQAKL